MFNFVVYPLNHEIGFPLEMDVFPGILSLRKHPFLLALRRCERFEERGETDVFAG